MLFHLTPTTHAFYDKKLMNTNNQNILKTTTKICYNNGEISFRSGAICSPTPYSEYAVFESFP